MTAEHLTWIVNILTGMAGIVAITWDKIEDAKITIKLKFVFCLLIISSIGVSMWSSHVDANEKDAVKSHSDSIVNNLLSITSKFHMQDSASQSKEYAISTQTYITIIKNEKEKNDSLLSINKKLKDIKDYNYWSKIDIYGCNNMGGVIVVSDTALNALMKKICPMDGGHILVDNNVLKTINVVIKKYPDFPYGYVAKYIVLKYYNDESSIIYAKKAISILKITTAISGHNPDHDVELKWLNEHM